MTSGRPERKPVQLSLFEQRTVSVSWVADRLKISRDTVVRLLQAGVLRGYRITRLGWWRVIETSVVEYEQKLRDEYALDGASGRSK